MPLENGKFGIGRITRCYRGILLGYFFGPAVKKLPSLEALAKYLPSDAVLMAQFSDMGLLSGEWPVLGQSAPWERDEWPIPVFARIYEDEGEAVKVYYDDSNLAEPIREVPCKPAKVRGLPEDGLYGDEALAINLGMLLLK